LRRAASSPLFLSRPLNHLSGFDSVFDRGIDGQHQLLGPGKELFSKTFEKTLPETSSE